MSKNYFLFFSFFIFLFACNRNVNLYHSIPSNIITAGKGFEEICINKKLNRSILRQYGKYKVRGPLSYHPYRFRIREPRKKVFTNNDSLLMVYVNKDFVFNKYKIQRIIVKKPFRCQTEKGIILGKSTKDDIFNKYGTDGLYFGNIPENDFELKNRKIIKYNKLGIEFLVDSTVYQISIFQPYNND